MRPQVVLRYTGLAVLFNAAFLVLSAVISAAGADEGLLPLAFAAVVAALVGVFPILFVPPAYDIRSDEGLATVVLSWLLASLIGALPYALYGGEFTFTNAVFESVSGFTTTGSTILNNIEALPTGLLFWRSTTHFIGGIGIIIFMLAVLPATSRAAMVLYKSELSEIAVEQFQYRTRRALQIILVVYVGLNLLEIGALMLAGMGLFDAITHAFATIATGGFSPRNTSLAYFHSPAVEVVVIVFMVLSGINFGVLFVTVTSNPRKIWQSAFVRYYLLSMAAGVLLVTWDLLGSVYPDWPSALRYAAFQLVSLATSTGFATTDSAGWPALSVLLLIFFSLQCACAGSTSGGIKVDRVVLFWKSIGCQLQRLKHPKAVISVKVENTVVDQEMLGASNLYLSLYLLVVFVSAAVLAGLGVDVISAVSGSVAAMGNVGPGFGMVSSMGNYSQIPALGKWVLSIVMLLGRLEIYGVIMLLFSRAIR